MLTNLHFVYAQFPATGAEVSSCDRACGPQGLNYLLFDPLQKMLWTLGVVERTFFFFFKILFMYI